MTDQTPIGRIRTYLHAHGEVDLDHEPIFSDTIHRLPGGGETLRASDLHAVLAERDQLHAELERLRPVVVAEAVARAEAAENALELLHGRLLRDLPGDASELPPPDDEFWAKQLDELVTYADRVVRGQRPMHDHAAQRFIAIARDIDGETITITVVDLTDRGIKLQLRVGWDDWRPASAGHRLIEHGYMINPTAAGRWTELPGIGHIAHVIQLEHADRAPNAESPQ